MGHGTSKRDSVSKRSSVLDIIFSMDCDLQELKIQSGFLKFGDEELNAYGKGGWDITVLKR